MDFYLSYDTFWKMIVFSFNSIEAEIEFSAIELGLFVLISLNEILILTKLHG